MNLKIYGLFEVRIRVRLASEIPVEMAHGVKRGYLCRITLFAYTGKQTNGK